MIALASDHAGFEFKERIKALLDALGLPYKDFGTNLPESTDYPDWAHLAAESVSNGEAERGIVVCASGVGVSIVANKSRGVRAANVTSVELAKFSRLHNDANVLALGARFVDWNTAQEIIKAWLSTGFEGGRHERRVAKIHSLTQC
jgi:ribose 5-phosphate isomerase B